MRIMKRLLVAGLMTGFVLFAERPLEAYTVTRCIMGTLYIDFFSEDGTYRGYMKINNSAQCE